MSIHCYFVYTLVLSLFLAISYAAGEMSSTAINRLHYDDVYIQFGANIGRHVKSMIISRFKLVDELVLHEIQDSADIHLNNISTSDSNESGKRLLYVSFGNTSFSQTILPCHTINSLPHESIAIKGMLYSDPLGRSPVNSSYEDSSVSYLVSNGRPLSDEIHRNISFDRNRVHYGAVLAAYATMELLGFAFLHPLDPYIPSTISVGVTDCSSVEVLALPSNRNGNGNSNSILSSFMTSSTSGNAVGGTDSNIICNIDVSESPYWPERSFHIHTQHPLEVTEVLQGFDIPQFGPLGRQCSDYSPRRRIKKKSGRKSSSTCSSNGTCDSGSSDRDHHHHHHHHREDNGAAYCERWEDMVDDANLLFEWSIANRLNKIEWLLLGNYKWGEQLELRLRRLQILTNLGHEYSILVGADCPIGNIQQHAWHIVNTRLPFDEQKLQIRERVDWIFAAGFDFLTTESGLSEFTHPECELMLDLINEFANYINGTWGREAGIKVHCSTGQSCSDYLDPRTGKPTNFNFLPMFATSKLGVFPHTVQMYAFDDPTAGAYGNNNFSYIEDYMVYEAKAGNRSVIYYGETSYWVNVDIDVPLFLPLYAQRRQHDLRRIAGREIKEGFRIDGQMNFDSGWEWGYWLNDVVTARASWNPYVSANATQADYSEKDDQWLAFASSLAPVARVLGPDIGPRFVHIITNLARVQADVLLFGIIDGVPSHNIMKLSGIAYLSGTDTWVDLPRKLGLHFLQPDKVNFKEIDDPDWSYVIPLLLEMDTKFDYYATMMKEVLRDAMKADELNDAAIAMLREFDDSMMILSLRTRQVRLLYQSHDPDSAPTLLHRTNLLKESRSVIAYASSIILQRESMYRVNWRRIASWRDNPTVYRYGYLWSVHSLYYWWRDQGRAEAGSIQSDWSPCYLNRMDITEIAVGWGRISVEVIRNAINRYSPYDLDVINCFAPPSAEYVFPRDLYN